MLPDGKPVGTGRVVFAATKTTLTSSANIESDGSFAFTSSSGDGLPEGDYKIRLEAGSSGDGKRGKTMGGLPYDVQFLDEDTSGLTATVTSDESKNSFELKLNPTKSEPPAAEHRGSR